MADNVTTQAVAPATLAAGIALASIEATFSGDTVQAGVAVLATSAGAEGARVLTLINPATQEKQDTGNTSLASIDGKLPVLGQALAAASVPVVLTAVQIATITPPAAIVGFALEAGHLATVDTSTAALAAVAGTTAGAAVITDANGTLQQYLRGIVKLAITIGGWLVTASGDVAHDGVDSGNPLKVGGKAASAEPAAVASGDRAQFVTDLVGKQIVLPYANPENFVSGCISSAMTGTTSTSLLAAPAAGLRNYITQITISNSHATVGTDLEIQDGSGGTTYYVIPAAAVYGGAAITFPTPLRQPTTGTAVFCKNTTTGANTRVSASGYKGA